MANYFGRWFGAASTGADTVAPTITLVSPVAFDPDFNIARATPVVFDVIDNVQLSYVTVFSQGVNLVYYGTPTGAFSSVYGSSSASLITGGYRLSILPAAGWSSGSLSFLIVAVDTSGNVTQYSVSFSVPNPTASTDQLPDFRDSVWRWRRRLNRQKCSVISIAIDDNYTDGPGFTLTALALEIGRKQGLDRVPWRGGTYTNISGNGNIDNGR